MHELFDNGYKSKGCFANHCFDAVFEFSKHFHIVYVQNAVEVQVNDVQEIIQAKFLLVGSAGWSGRARKTS